MKLKKLGKISKTARLLKMIEQKQKESHTPWEDLTEEHGTDTVAEIVKALTEEMMSRNTNSIK